jgi:hypothetical protein
MPRHGDGQGAIDVPVACFAGDENGGGVVRPDPHLALALGAVVFGGQAIWAAFLENWVRVIFGAVIAVICLYGLSRRRSLL